MIPKGKPVIQVIAMPKDTNPSGDIFGGWLLSQMDLAGAVLAGEYTQHRIVTIALDKMVFVKPVFVGDLLTCFVSHMKTGNTSITVLVEAWARRKDGSMEKVTEGLFTYVSIGEDRKPIQIT